MRKSFGVALLLFLAFATTATAASLPQLARDKAFDELKKQIPLSANVNETQGEDKRTALHYISWEGPADVAAMLIDKGADVNQADTRKRTPLHYAADEGNIPVMEVLLSKGADINAADELGYTPLMRVSSAKVLRPNVAEFLLKKGADVNATDDSGRTMLMRVLAMKLDFSNELTQFVINASPDPNIQDLEGKTALMYCIQFNADFWQLPSTMCTLPGTKIDLADKKGNTALHYTALSNSGEAGKIVNALLGQKANVNARNNLGQTPLFIAVDEQHDKALATLIINGKADVTVPDEEGVTTLHRAAYRNNVPLMKFLIENGADINATAKNGLTVLFAAGNSAQAKAFIQELAPASSAATAAPAEIDIVADLSPSVGTICEEYVLYHRKVDPSKAPYTGTAKKWFRNKPGERLEIELALKDGIAVSKIAYHDEPDLVKAIEETLDGNYCLAKTYHRNGGKIKSEGRYAAQPEVRKGRGPSYKKDGVFKEYHENGMLFREEGFVGGKREGALNTYDRKTGKLIEEVVISNGRKNGWLKEYYADGTLKKEVQYVDDREEGIRRDYTDKGVLRQTQEFKNARPDGLKTVYDKDGTTVKETQMFKEGRPVNQ